MFADIVIRGLDTGRDAGRLDAGAARGARGCRCRARGACNGRLPSGCSRGQPRLSSSGLVDKGLDLLFRIDFEHQSECLDGVVLGTLGLVGFVGLVLG